MITTDLYYPSQLPRAQRADHTSTPLQPFLRTQLERGRARQRRRFTSVPVMATFTWVFTDGEAALFELWFKETINDGASWFNMPRKTPLGQRMLVARFASMYEGPTMWGRDHWTYTAQIEFFERELYDKEWLILPGFIARPEIFDYAINQDWPAA